MSDIKLFRLSAGQATELQGRALDQKKTSANADRAIAVMTMNVSKGLVFPIVAMPARGEDEQEAARVFLCGSNTDDAAVCKWGGWVLRCLDVNNF